MNKPDPIPTRLAALRTTPTPDLKQQWRDLFDSEPPPFNRRYLESRLAYRIQELAYGGLKPETVRRLERLARNWTAGTRGGAASAPIARADHPERGCSRNGRASNRFVTVTGGRLRMADGLQVGCLPIRARHHRHALERWGASSACKNLEGAGHDKGPCEIRN